MTNKPSPPWDDWFLNLARAVASKSKDPSTKCGSILVHPDNTILSLGYNGFPRGMRDDEELYANRDVKYARVIHAEMNAILTAPTSPKGCTLYVWPFLTCSRCAIHTIQAGIVRVVASRSTNSRWTEDFKRARAFYAEAGVVVDEIIEKEK